VKKEKEEIPLHYFERNMLIVMIFVIITAILVYFTCSYFVQVHPLAFIFAVPASIFAFQTLWLFLNPYAVIYEDKFEIKKSMFSNKFWYFIDIKNVSDVSKKGFEITYNDDEKEVISTFGIRHSHKQTFRDAVNKSVCKSLVVDRAD
jgi:hypothetical protein